MRRIACAVTVVTLGCGAAAAVPATAAAVPGTAVPATAVVATVGGVRAVATVGARVFPAAAGGTVTDRTPRDPRISESSGLVVARRSPGIVWTHNDSGNPPLLYALGTNGSTVATVDVSGVADVDWEALAPTTSRDGTPLLAVGDIGDNSAVRRGVEVDLLTEPRVGPTGVRGGGGKALHASPVRVIHLRYPDGAHDAETLLSDPRTGRLYVVTKGLLSSTVYAVPQQAWPGGRGRSVTATLQPVGQVGLSLITDGAMLPDGRVLLRGYGSLSVLAPLPDPVPNGAGVPRLDPLATTGLPDQRQGEGLAVLDVAAGVILLSSEGVGQPVLRVTVPGDVWRAGASAPVDAASRGAATGTGTGSGRGTASGARTSAAGADGAAGAAGTSGAAGTTSGASAAWITLTGAAAFGVLLLVGWLAGRLRSRPW